MSRLEAAAAGAGLGRGPTDVADPPSNGTKIACEKAKRDPSTLRMTAAAPVLRDQDYVRNANREIDVPRELWRAGVG